MGLSTAAVGTAVTAGMIVSAAVVGATTSLASGLLNDNLTLKGVLRGALTAGLMQGVASAFNITAANPFTSVAAIAARTTVQGAVQALLGGSFKDGAIAGLASGLAEVTGANHAGRMARLSK